MALFERWVELRVRFLSRYLGSATAADFIIRTFSITSRFFAVLGIVTSIVAVSLLDKCDCVEKCMLVLSRYSFPIYLLHTIFTAGFRIVLLKIGVSNYLLHVLLGIIVGIRIPIIGMNIIKNCKILLLYSILLPQ